MATTAEIRNGLCIEFNEQLFQVVQFQHVKPGKGPAFVRTKLKNLKNRKSDRQYLFCRYKDQYGPH